MRICSVDPGKTGGLCEITAGYPSKFHKMPSIKVKSKTLVDPVGLYNIVAGFDPDIIVVEQVGASPRMGVSSAFNFGHAYGITLGVAAGYEVRCHTITPQKWKGAMGLLGKDKDDSRLKLIEMYSEYADLFKHKNSVDRAEAALIGLAWLKLERLKK